MKAVHHAVWEDLLQITPSPQTLLDIGCGDGTLTCVFAGSLPKTTITAMDTVTPRAIIPAQNVSFVKGAAEHLPFEDESFDVVISALSFHHWTDKEKGIVEIYRVLKRGGHLIMGDPLLENWLGNRFWAWLMQKIDGGTFSNVRRLHSYLEKAGFRSIAIEMVPKTLHSLFHINATKI